MVDLKSVPIPQVIKRSDMHWNKVKKIKEDSLDLLSSPSPSVNIQIMGGKVCLRLKGKTLLDIVNKQCFAFTPFQPII